MQRPLPLSKDPIAEAQRHWVDRGWADAADGMATVTALMRTQQILLSRVESTLKPYGLTFARYELLALLSFTRNGSLPMAKASARLQVHPTSVTNVVGRLEHAGFVRKLAHPTDGRATLVEITPEGRETALQATEALNHSVFARTGFTHEELSYLMEVLTHFRRHAGDFDESIRLEDY